MNSVFSTIRTLVRPVRFVSPIRSLSNIVRAEFAGVKDTRTNLGAIFSTTKLYKTDITPKQYEILEELRFMRIIPAEKARILENIESVNDKEEIQLDSVLRKRRLKMKKHKLRKRRKAQRALRRKLKKD